MEIHCESSSVTYRTQESLDSVRREAICITLIEFVTPMNLLRLT